MYTFYSSPAENSRVLIDAHLHVQQPFFTAAFVFYKALSIIRQTSGRAALSPQLSPSFMFKLFPSLANSSALGTKLLFVLVVDASLSGLPTLN